MIKYALLYPFLDFKTTSEDAHGGCIDARKKLGGVNHDNETYPTAWEA